MPNPASVVHEELDGVAVEEAISSILAATESLPAPIVVAGCLATVLGLTYPEMAMDVLAEGVETISAQIITFISERCPEAFAQPTNTIPVNELN